MKSFRLNRLFNSDSNRCFTIALDQGVIGERTQLQGLETLERTVQMLALAGPDALQLSIGQARLLQSIAGRSKPALILRLDVDNLGPGAPDPGVFCEMVEQAAEQALRLDAACVAVSLIRLPGEPDLTRQCIRNILALQPQCQRYGLPLSIEATAFRSPERGGLLIPDRDLDTVMPMVRQAVELGADLIQTQSTSDLGSFRKVVEASGVPVLLRGGGRQPDREVLESTEQLIAQGAGGIVYGRHVIQHPDPSGMTRALMAIVHERTRGIDAARFIRS